MISPSLSLTAICVLSIWTTAHAANCGPQQITISGRCCDECPPGTYMKDICSAHQQTVCHPCMDGHYSNDYDVSTTCEKCSSCPHEYAEKCTPTTNAKCSCRSGFLCSNGDCSRCVENKCGAGEKLKTTADASGQYSYQCEPLCNDNEYFDVKGNSCKLRTSCSFLGLAELAPGNKTHNSVCDTGAERHNSNLHVIHVMLGIGFVFLAVILLVFLSYACMKNTRKHKEHKPTNIVPLSTKTNDFHLSKEETGLQLIIQDESKNSDFDDHLLLEKIIAC